jgi:hypothetical protein
MLDALDEVKGNLSRSHQIKHTEKMVCVVTILA